VHTSCSVGASVGLRFLSIEEELGQILGRKVDLHTPNGLSPYLRDAVLSEAEEQYVKA
jgi:predicted nucleotidyltransferase